MTTFFVNEFAFFIYFERSYIFNTLIIYFLLAIIKDAWREENIKPEYSLKNVNIYMFMGRLYHVHFNRRDHRCSNEEYETRNRHCHIVSQIHRSPANRELLWQSLPRAFAHGRRPEE